MDTATATSRPRRPRRGQVSQGTFISPGAVCRDDAPAVARRYWRCQYLFADRYALQEAEPDPEQPAPRMRIGAGGIVPADVVVVGVVHVSSGSWMPVRILISSRMQPPDTSLTFVHRYSSSPGRCRKQLAHEPRQGASASGRTIIQLHSKSATQDRPLTILYLLLFLFVLAGSPFDFLAHPLLIRRYLS